MFLILLINVLRLGWFLKRTAVTAYTLGKSLILSVLPFFCGQIEDNFSLVVRQLSLVTLYFLPSLLALISQPRFINSTKTAPEMLKKFSAWSFVKYSGSWFFPGIFVRQVLLPFAQSVRLALR